MTIDQPLTHHGDAEAPNATVDFAVNVRGQHPPEFLARRLHAEIRNLGGYPTLHRQHSVRAAVARRHGIAPDSVLLLGGVSEGFSLLHRLAPARALVVHPSFTEPEWALRQAGIPLERYVLAPPFSLDAAQLCARAEALEQTLPGRPGCMVVVGNPTNPTGVLHQLEQLGQWADADRGRWAVVDEAFMDIVEPQQRAARTLLHQAANTPGLIVFRSLTKTWNIAGLRCGYAVAHPDTIAHLEHLRPAWPLGSLQLAALEEISLHGNHYENAESAAVAEEKAAMAKLLRAEKWRVHPSQAPFLLVQPPQPEVRETLAAAGIAIRRCDTFPGLDHTYWRVAVRPAAQVQQLVRAYRAACATGPAADH